MLFMLGFCIMDSRSLNLILVGTTKTEPSTFQGEQRRSTSWLRSNLEDSVVGVEDDVVGSGFLNLKPSPVLSFHIYE